MIAATQLIARATGYAFDKAKDAVEWLIEERWGAPSAPQAKISQPGDWAKSAWVSEQLTLNSVAPLIAHTEGACFRNPGPGGWAVVFTRDGQLLGQFSGPEPDTTNHRMELTAILEAIRRAPIDVALEINTDSNNAIGWLSKNWKRNDPDLAAICSEIDQLCIARTSAAKGQAIPIRFQYVRSHNGDPHNELAGRLATGEARKAAKMGTKRGSA